MGLEKPKDGAYQALEGVEKPVNGAWEMCEAVCKPVDGAWEEIWCANLFTVKANRNCTIEDENVTIAYSWAATSGDSGAFDIYGDFKADESYKITITCTKGSGTFYVSAFQLGSENASENFGPLTLNQPGTATMYITLSDDMERLYFYVGNGGETSGSYSGTFTDILVNDVECKYGS